MTPHDPRLDEILDVLLAVSRQDFSKRAGVYGKDAIDAVASGINMMIDELDGAVASRRDLESAYHELSVADARLVQAGKMIAVGQLASAVAHEVNNPATWVSLGLGIIARGSQELRVQAANDELDSAALTHTLDEIDQVLRDAVEGMERIRVVVGDLRTFSRADDEVLEDVCIDDVIRAACNLAGPSFRDRAALVLDLGETPSLVANRGRLAQVITNLIVNAAHAVQDCTQVTGHEIAIMTRVHEDGVLIAVEDTGNGVPEELREKIFQPLFTTKAATRGTGLGLTIAAQLVHGYGGFVRAVAGTRRGARFEVWLPSGPRPPRPVSFGSAVAVAVIAQPESRKRVLAIDDEPAILRAIHGILAPQGHEVVLAAGGNAALELLREDRAFDVLLCDLHMPDVDGVALHAWLREHYPPLAQRVIFLTGDLVSERARRFVTSTTPLVVGKPVSALELERALSSLPSARDV